MLIGKEDIKLFGLIAAIIFATFSFIAFLCSIRSNGFKNDFCNCSNCSSKHADFEKLVFQMHRLQYRVDILWEKDQKKEREEYLRN